MKTESHDACVPSPVRVRNVKRCFDMTDEQCDGYPTCGVCPATSGPSCDDITLGECYGYYGCEGCPANSHDGEPHDNVIPSPVQRADVKPTNPKDALGVSKVPLALVPHTAIAYAAIAHLNGALKYGAYNWRKMGVRASIYLDALERHVTRWKNGETTDEDGVPHLASAAACINILIDAGCCGKLVDDRPPSVPQDVIGALTPVVAHLRDRHADKAPHHFTIND